MCTVSFVPAGIRSCILTSNRDESLQRGLAMAPRRLLYNGSVIICPQDPLAHGSWIAAGEKGRLTCLLNGAFKRHKRHLPYRMSRGRVVLDSLTFDSAASFAAAYDFTYIEPFTMVMVSNDEDLLLYELRWDGHQKHFKELNASERQLWSSATLYDAEMMAEKESVFEKCMDALQAISAHTLSGIHEKHFRYEDWVLPPARVTEVATLSVTAVECNPDQSSMYYRDLVNKELPVAVLSV